MEPNKSWHGGVKRMTGRASQPPKIIFSPATIRVARAMFCVIILMSAIELTITRKSNIMARTKEPVDITAGTKTKELSIGSIKGIELKQAIVATASWTVPTVDELVNLLSSDPDSVLTEIASARMNDAVTSARADAIAASEPRELKVARFVKMATEKFGMSVENATQVANANFPE